MTRSQCTRDDLKMYKAALRQHAKELRVMARALGHDRKLQDLVERAAENAEDARDSIKLGPAPRKRTQAYTGGGTWHPAGMMPGGRMAPRRRSTEEW